MGELPLAPPATLEMVADVVDQRSPLRTSCAVPQSVALFDAPSAAQRSRNVGVVIDAILPSGAIQFTLQGTPPSDALKLPGSGASAAATRRMCVAAKTVTNMDAELPRLRADAMTEDSASSAGAQSGSERLLHEKKVAFSGPATSAAHEGFCESVSELSRVGHVLVRALGVVPSPATAVKTPSSPRTLLSVNMPSRSGHVDGRMVAGNVKTFDKP